MKKHINPYIVTGTCMIIVLMVAISVFYRSTLAGDKDVRITGDEARKIALSDAGEKAEEVTFTRTNLDDESGTPVYEVDFYTDKKKYEYEINAQTGSVREKEIVVQPATKSHKKKDAANEIDVIGVERAQAAALKAAGLKADEVSFTRTSLENEDGKVIYEVEFVKDGVEYEYDVDAYSGKILDAESEAESKEADDPTDDLNDPDDDDDYDDDSDDDDKEQDIDDHDEDDKEQDIDDHDDDDKEQNIDDHGDDNEEDDEEDDD